MSGKTPQQRTRDCMTDRGYLCGSVERRKRFPDRKKRQCQACGHVPMVEISDDLWSVFDIVAVHPQPIVSAMGIKHAPAVADVVFVQTTSRNNHATRRNKILSSMEAKLVLLSGARILLQSWRQPADSNKWQAYDEWITLDMYDQAPHYPNTVAELQEIKRKSKRPDLPPGSTLPLSTDLKDEEMPF